MKVRTPEIAWHETLPIYSCDLQPFASVSQNRDTELREPLSELSLNDRALTDVTQTKEEAVTEGEEKTDSVVGDTWTRLATAGGDSVVRLWRVNVAWKPPSSVTATMFKKPLPKDAQPSNVESDCKRSTAGPTAGASTSGANRACAVAASGSSGGSVKASAPMSDGLVFLATLKRHERLVNVVRWSPSGKYLASGGDDHFVIIWHMEPEPHNKLTPPPSAGNDGDGSKSLESWLPLLSLRRHLGDVYDLCWSPDETAFISGSVDQSVVLWNLDLSAESASSGKSVVLQDHKHYVQGVAWDPLGVYVASLSSDRSCRIYKAATKQCVATLSKVNKHHLFQDDSWKSFFRRLAFSPDGLMLICPAGNLEMAPFAGDMPSAVSTTNNKSASIASKVDTADSAVTIFPTTAPQHAAHIFLRGWAKKPCVSLPTGPRPVVAVRFCPQPFLLRVTNPEPEVAISSLFDLPYRWIFCLVLDDGILFFDTQQAQPFANVSQIHYQSLNDAAWSSDGRLVTVTSTDGYCSLIHFSADELGTPYRGPLGPKETSSTRLPPALAEVSSQIGPVENENVEEQKAKKTPEKDERPQIKAVEALKSEGRRHISFESGIETPERPHISLPVTPNTGRYLSAPVLASPMATTPTTVRSKRTGEKRCIPFITLSTEIESKPATSCTEKEDHCGPSQSTE